MWVLNTSNGQHPSLVILGSIWQGGRWTTQFQARKQELTVSLDIIDSNGLKHEAGDMHIRIQVVFMRFNLMGSNSCSRDLLSPCIQCLWFIDYEVGLRERERKTSPMRPTERGTRLIKMDVAQHTQSHKKNNTSYIKTHYLVVAIFKPPLFLCAYNKLLSS